MPDFNVNKVLFPKLPLVAAQFKPPKDEDIERAMRAVFPEHEMLALGVAGNITMARVYKIQMMNGMYALKIAPAEVIKNEVVSNGIVKDRSNIPLPTIVYHTDDNRFNPAIPYPYFISQWIQGTAFLKAFNGASPVGKIILIRKLARCIKELHSIKFRQYGNIADEKRQFSKWSDYFNWYLNQLLTDQSIIEVLSKPLVNLIKQVTEQKKSFVNSASGPVLIHNDCNGYNLLVEAFGNDNWSITGLIDFGDSLAGPPDIEMARILLTFWDQLDSYYLDVFLSEYGPLPEGWQIRARLWGVCLLLHSVKDAMESAEISPEPEKSELLEKVNQRILVIRENLLRIRENV